MSISILNIDIYANLFVAST